MSKPPPRLPEPGEVIAGKYALRGVLGKGGVGVVYEAEHLKLRQRVALKVLSPEMLEHPAMVERFEREARAMAMLANPYVTRVIDVDATPEGIPFLVMEFLHGHDLQSELKTRGALPVDEAVHWVRQACEGMSVVHATGIVHRDLKPANLFLAEAGGARTLKIMDFGISKIVDDDVEVTSTIATLGTPAYMAPEQVKSAKHIDARADVWSLGVILYRALSGRLPFQGSGSTGMAVAIVNDEPIPLETLRPDTPAGVVAVVRRALAKNAADRFSSVMALSDALATAMTQPHVGAAPVTAPTAAASWQSDDGASIVAHERSATREAPRRSTALIAAGVLVVAAAGAAGVYLGTPAREPTGTPASGAEAQLPKVQKPSPETKPAEAEPEPPPAASAAPKTSVSAKPVTPEATATTSKPQPTGGTKPPSAPKPIETKPTETKPAAPKPTESKPAPTTLPTIL